jgi:hypothetical protein
MKFREEQFFMFQDLSHLSPNLQCCFSFLIARPRATFTLSSLLAPETFMVEMEPSSSASFPVAVVAKGDDDDDDDDDSN